MNSDEQTKVLLSLGSNLNDRKANILSAIELIKISGALTNVEVSSFYETAPVGVTEQPSFLNIAATGYSSMLPSELLPILKSIEKQIGRQERERWHEREIDIDIILYGTHVFLSEDICIPHPRAAERRFVLAPAAEIAGDMLHPIENLSISQLLSICPDSSEVKLSSEEV